MNRAEHILTCVGEEGCEVGQRISKALRFGLFERQPEQPDDNGERVRSEVYDLIGAYMVETAQAMAGTGRIFPFFSATLGWMGVFLTGSDTSANALFGNLQVVTARALSLNPVLTASVNSAAGVMGKMISVQSIAVAVAATGMMREDESRLFRFTIRHSVLLMIVMGIISMMYAYVFPQFVPNG